jgi:hypothetical protein
LSVGRLLNVMADPVAINITHRPVVIQGRNGDLVENSIAEMSMFRRINLLL